MKTNLQNPLCGIIPPLVTPLKDNGSVDRLIERLIQSGVNGLFILETTEE